jgi:hypothetical protein
MFTGHYIEMVPAVVNNTGVFPSKDASHTQQVQQNI